jgi:hypothetical protein
VLGEDSDDRTRERARKRGIPWFCGGGGECHNDLPDVNDIVNAIGYDIGQMPNKAMHQTTVRFGADLWEDLLAESERVGVSIAQYVREAAVARLAYNAAMRGDGVALGASAESIRFHDLAQRTSDDEQTSEAVWAQSRLARERAQRLRREAESARTRRSTTRV